MALEVQIGADSSNFDKEIAKVEKQLSDLRKQESANIKLGLDTASLKTQISDATTKLNGLKSSVNNSASAFQSHSKATANGGNTLMQFSRIAQDAPFGLIGIGNNLTATAESFANLSKSAGGTGNALKSVASSLMGTGGILLALSLVTSGLTYMSQKGITVGDVFAKLTGDFDEYADALKKANLAAYSDEGVVKAVADVNQLRTEVQLAKDGFIDKTKVIEHYNETMGKTTGIVKTLDGVEQQLVKNGEAFIKMQLYKATATLAQAEAAKELLNREKISKQSIDEHTGALEYLKGAFIAAASGQGIMSTGAFAATEGLKAQASAFDASGKKMQANLSIAEKYNKKAGEIAKDNNFNFFESNKVANNKNAAENERARKKELEEQKKFQEEKLKFERDFFAIRFEGIKSHNAKVLKEQQIANITPADQLGLPEDSATALPDFGYEKNLQALRDFNSAASEIINGSISDTFAALGANIGNALATGGNVLQAAGNALLSGLGGILTEMGKMAIEVGVGLLGIKAALKTLNPYAAIAAGVALVALGSVFSSKSKALGSSMGGGASSGGGGATTNIQTGANISSPQSSVSNGGTFNNSSGTVVFEIAGQKLIGVLNNTLGANQRLGGSLSLGN